LSEGALLAAEARDCLAGEPVAPMLQAVAHRDASALIAMTSLANSAHQAEMCLQ